MNQSALLVNVTDFQMITQVYDTSLLPTVAVKQNIKIRVQNTCDTQNIAHVIMRSVI